MAGTRRQVRTAVRRVVVALAVVAVAGGCSPTSVESSRPRGSVGDEAKPAPSPGPVTADTVAPARPTAQRPAGMDGHDQEAAVAATLYFFSLLGDASATGDTSEWDEMSAPGCVMCTGFNAQMTEAYRTGDFAAGSDLTVNEVWVADPLDGLFQVALGLDFVPVNEAPEGPAGVAEVPLALLLFRLERTDRGWLVHEIVAGGPDDVPESALVTTSEGAASEGAASPEPALSRPP